MPHQFQFDRRAKLKGKCPMSGCGAGFQYTLEDVDKQRELRCSRGHTFTLVDGPNGIAKAEKDVNKALNGLKRSIERRNGNSH